VLLKLQQKFQRNQLQKFQQRFRLMQEFQQRLKLKTTQPNLKLKSIKNWTQLEEMQLKPLKRNKKNF
jgi:hypothetical protein